MTRRRDVRARARRVRLLVLDVDGVLTDGRMILTEQGDELKSFHTHDGMGVAVARRAGIKVAIVTGEKSVIGQRRGAKLGVEEIVLGSRRKAETVEELGVKLEVPAGPITVDGTAITRQPIAVNGVSLTVNSVAGTNSTPRARNVSSARNRCDTERAKRSNRHTSTVSNRRL